MRRQGLLFRELVGLGLGAFGIEIVSVLTIVVGSDPPIAGPSSAFSLDELLMRVSDEPSGPVVVPRRFLVGFPVLLCFPI
jgi:hypothetical protein